MGSIIQPGKFTGGSYKRPKPGVIKTLVFNLSAGEIDAIRKGKRRCSCDGSQLRRLGEKVAATAAQIGAKSWSIFPIPYSLDTTPSVLVEYHNWGEMGMCNFNKPVGKKRYWWDERPVPQWITGDERGEKDKDGMFDPNA